MQTFSVARARNNFTHLYHEVTEGWNECLVKHGSKKNPYQMSLIPTEFLDAMVDKTFKFTTDWTYTKDDTAPEGWWTVWVPQLNLFGDGPDKESALQALVDAVIDEVTFAFRDLRSYFGNHKEFNEKFPYFRRIARLQADDGSFDYARVADILTESETKA